MTFPKEFAKSKILMEHQRGSVAQVDLGFLQQRTLIEWVVASGVGYSLVSLPLIYK